MALSAAVRASRKAAPRRRSLWAFAFCLLGACGGAASDSKDDTNSPEPPVPIVSITSHSEGQRVLGSRQVTVSGLLEDVSALGSVQVLHNGAEVTATVVDQAFSFGLTLGNGSNTIQVVASNSAGTSNSRTLTLFYPYLSLGNLQDAQRVIGQPDFSSKSKPNPPTAASVGALYGSPAFADGVYYFPDYENDRVLGYLSDPKDNGAAADFVLGQPDLTTRSQATSPTGMANPQGLAVGEDRLFAVDYSNRRILIWNSLPKTTGTPASLVLGAPDLSTPGTGDCSATSFLYPSEVLVADGKLIVVDDGHHRVLIWNAIPTVNNVPADVVLGQQTFTRCAENDDDQNNAVDAAPSARTLRWPSGAWSDGTRLFVSDGNNNRILIWNQVPTSHFAPADGVLGQPNFTTAVGQASKGGLDYPAQITSNGNQLFVADLDNHRVLVWNAVPTTSQTHPDVVLGQLSFTTNASHDVEGDGTGSTTPSAKTFYYPSGLAVNDLGLWVTDQTPRFLYFAGQ
ncbi:MAG TPA: hypothetical protein VEY30_11220 [Myxococcaceae bacterium]|nr:hypothetical protein [Myxococcaceae bacterium]